MKAMKPIVMAVAGALSLVYALPVLGQTADQGTKPIVKALHFGEAPRRITASSPEAFAQWDAAQTKPSVRLLRAERERLARESSIVLERSTAFARCMGTKPALWTPSRCGEEHIEEGAASGRP